MASELNQTDMKTCNHWPFSTFLITLFKLLNLQKLEDLKVKLTKIIKLYNYRSLWMN